MHLRILTWFLLVCFSKTLYLCVCVLVHVHGGGLRVQKRPSDPRVPGCLTRGMGTDLCKRDALTVEPSLSPTIWCITKVFRTCSLPAVSPELGLAPATQWAFTNYLRKHSKKPSFLPLQLYCAQLALALALVSSGLKSPPGADSICRCRLGPQAYFYPHPTPSLLQPSPAAPRGVLDLTVSMKSLALRLRGSHFPTGLPEVTAGPLPTPSGSVLGT